MKIIFVLFAYVITFLAISLVVSEFILNEVILYKNILIAVTAAILIQLLVNKKTKSLNEKILFFLVMNLTGICYAMAVPTIIDRSLSIYILEEINRKEKIHRSEIEKEILNNYLNEYSVINTRIFEQLKSGTIIIDGNECITLSDRGKLIVLMTNFYKKVFLNRKKLAENSGSNLSEKKNSCE